MAINHYNLVILLFCATLINHCSRAPVGIDDSQGSEDENAAGAGYEDYYGSANGQVQAEAGEDYASGSAGAVDQDELEEISANLGIRISTLKDAALYIGAWTGDNHDIPSGAQWRISAPKGTASQSSAATTANAGTANAGATGATAGTGPTETGQTNTGQTNQGAGNQNTDPNAPVIFRIKAGTGQGPWNDASTAIVGRANQTIRIFNDDNIPHQLHTNGAPCNHGSPIPPGGSYDCVVQRPYTGGPLYDHLTDAAVHIKTQ